MSYELVVIQDSEDDVRLYRKKLLKKPSKSILVVRKNKERYFYEKKFQTITSIYLDICFC